MPLTPQDVRAKLFTSVRFKHGYDEEEVDAFLDQVETDLGLLYSRIESLTADLAIARSGSGQGAGTSILEPDTASFAPVTEVPVSLTDVPSAADTFEGDSGAAAEDDEPASSEVVVPNSAPEPAVVDPEGRPTEEMLRRTLLLAQRTADALIQEARAEAETLVSDARNQAAHIENTTKLEHETRQRILQAEHDQLNGLVEQLRAFEEEYRSRLRAYLHLQLRDLENSSPAEPQQQIGTNNERAALGSTGSVDAAGASGDDDVSTDGVAPTASDEDDSRY